MKEYILLLSEYWDCYFKSSITSTSNPTAYSKSTLNSKNSDYNQFVFTRGLDTITHIFIYTLQTSGNNVETAYTAAEKGIYYYIEFMNQMKEHKQMNLSLTTREAVLYVYKKTIYSKQPQSSEEDENIPTTSTSALYKELNVFYNRMFYLYLDTITTDETNKAMKHYKKDVIHALNEYE